jgi:transposase
MQNMRLKKRELLFAPRNSKVLHFDETGIRCEKKLHGVHVTSSATATFYGIHNKRGQEAVNDFNVLPRFGGVAIHDHWFPYFAYLRMRTKSLSNCQKKQALIFLEGFSIKWISY